jgi:hypothetical protein
MTILHAFPVVRCPGFIYGCDTIVYTLEHYLSVIRDLAIAALLASNSFCGNRVFKMNIQFCCPVTCAAEVL